MNKNREKFFGGIVSSLLFWCCHTVNSAYTKSQVKFILPSARSTQEGISEKTVRSSKSTAPIAMLKSNRRKLRFGNK